MADVLGFLNGRKLVQDVLTVDAVATEGVYGKIAHSQRSQVLEEVGSLAGIYLIVVEACLNDNLRGADVWPFYGDS